MQRCDFGLKMSANQQGNALDFAHPHELRGRSCWGREISHELGGHGDSNEQFQRCLKKAVSLSSEDCLDRRRVSAILCLRPLR
jgi:hypothetical protein